MAHTRSEAPEIAVFKDDRVMVNVMSVVDVVTSTVPLPVMLLVGAIKQGDLPHGVAVLQVMPCKDISAEPAGQRIFSLWQGADVETIAAAVEATIGEHCTSTLFPVMETHAHGISKESLEEKLARHARSTARSIESLDARLGVSGAVIKGVTTGEQVVSKTMHDVWEKTAGIRENPTVAKTLDVGAKGWNSLVGGFTAAAAMVDRTRDSLVKRGQEMAGPSEEALAVNAPAAIIQPAAAGAAGAGAGADAIPTSTSPSGAGDDDGKPAPLLA